MAEVQLPVAIVTGGARGIGAAICKALLKEGYRVCIADILEEKGKEFLSELQNEFGEGKVIFSRCDVTKDEEFDATFRLTLENFKRIDFVMNNAGIAGVNYEHFHLTGTAIEDDPKKIILVNLIGVITGCQLALKYMGKSKGGKGGIVVNTASLAGLVPLEPVPTYTASKHGVIGYTRSYGQPAHFEKEGVIFAAICPSYTDTEMVRRARADPSADNLLYPNLIQPEYVAGGVMKILKERINGSVLVISKTDGYEYVDIPKNLENLLSK